MSSDIRCVFAVLLYERDSATTCPRVFKLREFPEYVEAYVWVRDYGASYLPTSNIHVHRYFKIEQIFC